MAASDPWQLAMVAGQYWVSAAQTALYAGITINARLALMGQALLMGQPWPAAEMWRMVAEKQEAALRSASLALTPYHRATRANARRLMRRR
jgi:hypothetical protein